MFPINQRFTRRKMMLQVAPAAALAATGVIPALAADISKTDPGPSNREGDTQNPDSTWPPPTDSKSLVPTFKYPFSLANKRIYEGGWSREVTVRELPLSKTMAGVNMRLTAGGAWRFRWHTAGGMATTVLCGAPRPTAGTGRSRVFVPPRRSTHRRFECVQGLDHGCDGNGHASPGRPARTSLAPQCRRVAVLHFGQGKNDCGGDW